MSGADESVGRLIYRRRQELGLSQSALARLLATRSGRPIGRKRVGDWEHECCGEAIERNDMVDLGCSRLQDAGGQVRLIETHHDSRPETHVRGRVVDILVLADDGSTTPILRLPSGAALRGFDDEDDGHLESPWTGELVKEESNHFLIVVKR